MRMGSFIVGGIIGAAITIYMKQNNNSMMQTLSSAGQFINKMMDSEVEEKSDDVFFESEDTAISHHMQ